MIDRMYIGSPYIKIFKDIKKKKSYEYYINMLTEKLQSLGYTFIYGHYVRVLRKLNCYTVYVPDKMMAIFLHFGNFSPSDTEPYKRHLPENYKSIHIYNSEINNIEKLLTMNTQENPYAVGFKNLLGL